MSQNRTSDILHVGQVQNTTIGLESQWLKQYHSFESLFKEFKWLITPSP